MNNWWEIAFSGACLVALGMLGLGLWMGYRWGHADADMTEQFRQVPAAVPKARQPRPDLRVRPKHVAPSTAELFHQLELEIGPPTIAMQPPMRALVQPGRHAASSPRKDRTTDFIKALAADTDQYIAAMETTR